MPPTGGLLVTYIFERGVMPVARLWLALRSVGIASRWQLRTPLGEHGEISSIAHRRAG